MVARKFGRIVNIASDAGAVGSSGEAVYSACKGGLIALGKTLAREHIMDGIVINTVCPGPTETPLLAQMAADGGLGEQDRSEARTRDADAATRATRRLSRRRRFPVERRCRLHHRPDAVGLRRSDDARLRSSHGPKVLLTVFATVFVAELGDKTQLATMLYAADREVSKLTVFLGASLALVLASGIGVVAGSLLSEYISEKVLHYVAGVGFIVIGIWTLIRA